MSAANYEPFQGRTFDAQCRSAVIKRNAQCISRSHGADEFDHEETPIGGLFKNEWHTV
jgi:hypothetical protein